MNKADIRRLLIILVFAAMVTVAAACALADDPAPAEVSTWAELQTALSGSGSIRLTESVSPGENDGLLTVPENAEVTLDLNGCDINRGLADSTAAAYGYVIQNNGTLTVTGNGRITGGNNLGDCGAILNTGTLTLSGGSITGNKATASGGGIYNSGMLILAGGSISGNTVGTHGGGIYNSGTLNLKGGSVTGNTAGDQGGGILQNGVIEVSGATEVSGNTGGNGNNIYLRGAHPTLTVSGALTDGDRTANLWVTRAGVTGAITAGYGKNETADPENYFHADQQNLGIELKNGEASVKNSWEELRTALLNGDHVKLEQSYTAGPDDLGLFVYKTATLDLNGYTIDRGLAGGPAKSDGYALKNDGELTITDSRGGGRITGGNNTGSGGGIYNKGTLKLEGGEISGNASSAWGGGIYLPDGSSATLIMSGGVITGNTCKNDGGGVHVSGKAFMQVSGKPMVYGNRKKDGNSILVNNIKLVDRAVIEVTGALADGAELSVTGAVSGGSGIFTRGYGSNNPAEPAEYFSPDIEGYSIHLTGGEAYTGYYDDSVNSWSGLQTALNRNGLVILTESVSATSDQYNLRVPQGVTAILDLNGHDVNRNRSGNSAQNGFVIRNQGNLTIIDSKGGGAVTGGYTSSASSASTTGGIFNEGTLTMSGVTVSGNRTNGSGGGICNDGTLNLNDVTITGNVSGGYGGGIYNNGTITLTGADISGNTAAKNGGGIHNNSGTVQLRNSVLSGNSCQENGDNISNSGTIIVSDSEMSGGTVAGVFIDRGGITMSSGSITGSQGHGVLVDGGSFTLNGSSSVTGNAGCGVCVTGGSFIMSGGTVTGSGEAGVSTHTGGSFRLAGGSITDSGTHGVEVRGGGFTLISANIEDGIDLGDNGVISIVADLGNARYQIIRNQFGVFTRGLNGRGTAANFMNDVRGWLVTRDGNGEAELELAWSALKYNLEHKPSGAVITLMADCIATPEVSGPLTVEFGHTLTLDLAGHTIDRGLAGGTAVQDGQVIHNMGNLIIKDSVGGGLITGGNRTGTESQDMFSENLTGGGGIENSGNLTLQGVTVAGNHIGDGATGNLGAGGGIFNSGTLNIIGGAVRGNSSNYGGGGIYNRGTLTLNGCSVTGNETKSDVGSVLSGLVCGGGIMNAGSLTINGGEIRDNTSDGDGGGILSKTPMTLNSGEISGNTSGGNGGGICLVYTSAATLNLNGGVITGNSAVRGGGVYVSGNAGIKVSGSPAVYGNTGNNDWNNIRLEKATGPAFIRFGSALAEGANLWVSTSHDEGVITSGFSARHADSVPGVFFRADKTGYGIMLRDGEAVQEECFRNVSYVRRGWDGSTGYYTYDTAEEAARIPSDGAMRSGWYYLDRDVTVDGRICLEGNTSLILGDGTTLRVKGLHVPVGCTLTIYGQNNGTGRIISTPADGAGIGAYAGHLSGNIIIHGGTINATGANNCAGIGGSDGDEGMVPDVTIYGGTVTATGGKNGAGIGGGRNCDGGYVRIYGGTVTATGKDSSAGIGSGDPSGKTAYSSLIDIFGGTVTAVGNSKGAGIGGGEYGFAKIRISGGTVHATGGATGGAGIGTGADAKNATVCYPTTVEITGGTVTAVTRDSGAKGIGNGKGTDNCTVTLDYKPATKFYIRVTSPSYGGTVTLKRPFIEQDSDTLLPAGTLADNSVLDSSILTATNVVLSDWAKLQWRIDCAGNGNVITLEKDCLAAAGDTALRIPGGKNIILNLNGKQLDRGLGSATAAAENGSVIEVAEGGSLTVTDSAGSGTITGGYAASGGGIRCAGYLTLEGGTIENNNASCWGGGIYLTNGTGATLTLAGGTVRNNTCGKNGGGIHVSESATMSISGCPTVYGNRRGSDTDNNVNLAGGAVMRAAGELTHTVLTERIHVSRSSGTGILTAGLAQYGSGVSFAPDNLAYTVVLNGDGEAELRDADAAALLFFRPGDEQAMGADPVPENPMSVLKDEDWQLPDCSYAVPGKHFKEWSVRIGDAAPVSRQPNESVTVTADTEITAVWEDHVHDFTYAVSEDGRTITAACGNADGACDLPDCLAAWTLEAPSEPPVYDGTEKAAALTGEIPGMALPEIVYTKGGAACAGTPADAGTYTAGVTLAGVKTGADTTGSVTASVSYTILPQPILLTGATAAERDYEAGNRTVAVSGVTFDGAELTPGADYTATGEMEDENAGDEKNVTVAVTLLNGNYALPEDETTVTATVRIGKAGYPGTRTAAGEAAPGTAGATLVLPELPAGARYDGEHITVDGATHGLIIGTPAVEETDGVAVLTYSVSAHVSGSTAVVIPVTGADNYLDYNVTVTITATGETDAAVSIAGGDRTVVWGDGNVTLSATAAYPGENAEWIWSVGEAAVAEITGGNGSGTVTLAVRNAGVTAVTVLYNADGVTGSAGMTLTVMPASVPVPAAVSGLKWTGSEQVGVEPGAGYDVSGGSAAETGCHTATATLASPVNYRWSDGTTEQKVIPWCIAKADGPAAPAGAEGVAPSTAESGDGKITGVTAAMEYAAEADFSDAQDCAGNEITGLPAGTYHVRLKETETHEAGAAAEVTVPEYTEPEPPKTIIASVTGYSGSYDGLPHGVDVSVTAPETGWVIRYGTAEGACNLDACPLFTDAGTQTVYYRITADGYAAEEGSVAVEIIPACPEVTPPRPAEDLMYNGGPQKLITAGSVDGNMATLVYAKTRQPVPPSEESYTTMLPKAKDAGTWYVWYKAIVNEAYRGNYQDTNITAIAVTIYRPEPEEAAFRLPAQVTRIEANAFEGNPAITTVDAGNCSVIGAEAFKDCTGLTQIRLPEHCRIDPSAFTGCGQVFVFAPEGGTTEANCENLVNCNCIFVPVDEE